MNQWVLCFSGANGRTNGWLTLVHIFIVFLLLITLLMNLSYNNKYSVRWFKMSTATLGVRMFGSDLNAECVECTTETTSQPPKPMFNHSRNILEEMLEPTIEHRGLRAFRLFEKRFNKDSFWRDHCRTCALVTSSGYLEGSRSASVIDSHQCVLRTNDSPVLGFEKDIGYRTTHRYYFSPIFL